jgi:diguanylate cyclase (GGDEF)-like protein/PAS domain S-box-containing protein
MFDHPTSATLGLSQSEDDTQLPCRSPRLLLVDDEPKLLDSLRALLDGENFELASTSAGAEACQLLSATPFDLVLLDLGMPDVSGHQVMDFIRHENIDTHIIVISGDIDINAAIGALKRGAYDYLRKPYHRDDLLHTIAKALKERHLADQHRLVSEKLLHSEKLYRYLVDSSPDIIYTLNEAGEFTFMNQRGYRLLGFRPEEIIGKHYSSLIHDSDIDRARYVFNERRVGDRASRDVELRLKCLRDDGAERAFEHDLMLISFNSTGMYLPNEDSEEQAYFGTYGVARDISDRKRTEALLSHHAYHDILTDLPNRTLFRDRLGLAMIQARRHRHKLAILLIDLDRFKRVNDSLGHVKGDELLKDTAGRLGALIGRGDTLARLSSDEFAILLPEIQDLAQVAEIGRKIVDAIATPYFLDEYDNNVFLTASVGIATFPGSGDNVDDLIRHADNAMFHVKTHGKNGMAVYDASMEDASQHKIVLERNLRRAMENGELEMYYQPQIDIRTGAIIGAEGLMRWNHPTSGLLGAGAFLPFAEEIGLILPISDWMLDALCADLKTWRSHGGEHVRLSLNVSPQYLDRGDFTEKLQRAMAAHGIDADQIEVEITENLCIGNPQYAIEQLRKLGQLGVKIAIDDFGTGYSSLSYLHRFPIDTLKIDQSFVREIHAEDGHYPVVTAIIAIAHGLNLHLIAEGVETEVQTNYLKKSGCNTLQGYRFHRPMPHRQFLDLLQAGAKNCPHASH